MTKGKYVRTTEIRKKNKLAVLGRKMPKNQKDKISKANKGRKMSKEWKDNIAKSKIGKPRCEKVKKALRKMAKARTGKKNPNWKGGKTKLILSIRACEKYKQWRSNVFARDKWRCQTCLKKSEGDLEAHHIIGLATIIRENNLQNIDKAKKHKFFWDLENGVTLCRACHKRTSNYKNRGG